MSVYAQLIIQTSFGSREESVRWMNIKLYKSAMWRAQCPQSPPGLCWTARLTLCQVNLNK